MGGVLILFDTVDTSELLNSFGPQLQANVKKNLQRILRHTGWNTLNTLHLSFFRQEGGFADMLFWWVELSNSLAADFGHARWQVPFTRQAFLEPLVLPSGQLLNPDEIFTTFLESRKKINQCLQYNTGQLRPYPGRLGVRGHQLFLIQDGRQSELLQRDDLKFRLKEYFQPRGLQVLSVLPPEHIARQILTEDDFALYGAVIATVSGWIRPELEKADYQMIVVYNFSPLGLLPELRNWFPNSLCLWRNQLTTADPTPAAWNYFVPAVNQAHVAMYYLSDYHPNFQPDLQLPDTPVVFLPPSLYPFSPKHRELDRIGMQGVKRVLAQYQREYILVTKIGLKEKIERAYLKLTGARMLPEQVETVMESLTKASIRAAFIDEGRRPEMADFSARAAESQAGMIDLVRQLHGLDPQRPLFTQIARFDHFKDPVGTVTAFVRAYLRLLREDTPPEAMPQFAYAGNLIEEDPQTFEELLRIFIFLDHLRSEIKDELGTASGLDADAVYRRLRRDIFILILPMNDSVANAIEVNAFQRTSRALLQKSIREGFGLVVAEAMWKGVPVIGGNTGGIRLQIDHGTNGFLAGQMVEGELRDSVEDAAEYIVTYTKYADMADRMGQTGRQKVGKDFLMPVNLNLWLQKIGDLLISAKIKVGVSPETPKAKKTGRTQKNAPVPDSPAV